MVPKEAFTNDGTQRGRREDWSLCERSAFDLGHRRMTEVRGKGGLEITQISITSFMNGAL